MKISMYDIIYLCSTTFGTYTIYKYFRVFFDKEHTTKKTEILSFICYNIAISFIYIFINIPMVLMLCNILAFFLLSWNYKSSFKIRVLAVLFIYLILMCIEMLIVLLTGYLKFPVMAQNNYSSIFGILSIKIISFAVVLIISNFKNIRKGKIVPNSYWACIALIPAASLYIIIVLFCAEELTSTQLIMSIIFILLINFSTFRLYDVITKVMWDQMDKKLLKQQNQYYDRQFRIMKDSLQALKEMKHDWKNHLSALHSLIQNGEIDKSLLHISEMLQISSQSGQARTGNIIIDSILNFKLQEASRNNIEITLDINVPENMNVPSFDMTVLVGNLIDNALEAVLKLEENRFIHIKMAYDKSRFLCYITNPFTGAIKKEGPHIVTTKDDRGNHGIGFESVKSVLKKYDGTLEIEHDNNIFSVLLMIYVEE